VDKVCSNLHAHTILLTTFTRHSWIWRITKTGISDTYYDFSRDNLLLVQSINWRVSSMQSWYTYKYGGRGSARRKCFMTYLRSSRRYINDARNVPV
jgi:hypothetical protein